jgi:hypothetical protein
MSALYQTAAREVFTTSRLAEFCTQRELEKQTGHSAKDWPVYIVKELIDNALDAAEEAGLAPRIEIEISSDSFTVKDNGPGITADTVERLLDLSSRTSARARYVSPTRGAQGQALSTILVMPYALAPESGSAVIIESHGLTHRIAVRINKLTGEPQLTHEATDGSVKSGTRISVEWSDSASTLRESTDREFLPLALAYVLANPHVALSLQVHDDSWTFEAIDPSWSKWRACDPTSPHWYTPETFERLIAAFIQKDQQAGRRRPLRDFLGQFDGLSGTTRRSKVLAAANLNRATLDGLLRDGDLGEPSVAALLQAIQTETAPVKPARLGIIGKTNLRDRLVGDGFKYACIAGVDRQELPYVIEGAFVWNKELDGRRLYVGANFAASPALSINLGGWETASDVLGQRHVSWEEPIIVFLHITHPRLNFTDLGKTQLSLPSEIACELRKVIEKITAEWHKQRQREERDARAAPRRQDALERSRRTTIKDSVYAHLADVYPETAGEVGARSRQLFYALRPLVLADTGQDTLEQDYIVYTLIPEFIAENPELCAAWTVFYDDRGHLIEPHTGEIIGLGTRNVRDYWQGWGRPVASGFEVSPPTVATCGPIGRYSAILFCEKEGFTELFQAVRLPERFDLALASTKGTSVTAARELFEMAGRYDIPIFALHDFDYNGFEIATTLCRDTRRYQFEHPPRVIDIGLRLTDVERLGLESEPVAFGNRSLEALRDNLELNGATEAEIAYLIDGKQRVELNAVRTPQLLELIETALIEHGVGKVTPDGETLAEAYRQQIEYRQMQKGIEEAIETARREVSGITVPADLAGQVAAYLEENPTEPWETAIQILADNGGAA